MVERGAVASELEQLGEWFHNLHLPCGVETALAQARWARQHMQLERPPVFRKLSVYRLSELAGEATNWWAANEACARAMLRSSGFDMVDTPGHETWWCRAGEVDPDVRAKLAEVLAGRLTG